MIHHGLRPWQLSIWRQNPHAPMVSLGIHVDFHTPTIDLHLPFGVVQIGRNLYWRRSNALPGMRVLFRDRLLYCAGEPWSGHTDNCDHPR